MNVTVTRTAKTPERAYVCDVAVDVKGCCLRADQVAPPFELVRVCESPYSHEKLTGVNRTIALCPISVPGTSWVASLAMKLTGNPTMPQPAGSLRSVGPRGTNDAKSVSVIEGLAGVAGTTRGVTRAGQYQGVGQTRRHVTITDGLFVLGMGVTIVVVLRLVVAGLPATPDTVFVRVSVTPPPEIPELVHSLSGGAQAAKAGAAAFADRVLTRTATTPATQAAATRTRRGRIRFRVAAMR